MTAGPLTATAEAPSGVRLAASPETKPTRRGRRRAGTFYLFIAPWLIGLVGRRGFVLESSAAARYWHVRAVSRSPVRARACRAARGQMTESQRVCRVLVSAGTTPAAAAARRRLLMGALTRR